MLTIYNVWLFTKYMHVETCKNSDLFTLQQQCTKHTKFSDHAQNACVHVHVHGHINIHVNVHLCMQLMVLVRYQHN